MKTPYDIILRPIVTEQAMEDIDVLKYFFEVDKRANKIEIADAVEEIFHVSVVKVTTEIVKGKPKRSSRGKPGRSKTWKKASVRLSGDSEPIEIFTSLN